METDITDEEAIGILESAASRRKRLDIVLDARTLKANKWTGIASAGVIGLMLLALVIWTPLSPADFLAEPAVLYSLILFLCFIWPLMQKVSRLEQRYNALVAFMNSEQYFDKKAQSQQESGAHPRTAESTD